MQLMQRLTVIFSTLVLFIVIGHDQAFATYSGCKPVVKAFSIKKAKYDIAKAGDTTAEIYYVIRNDGRKACEALRVYFCSRSSTQSDGYGILNFRVQGQSRGNLINVQAGGFCPYYSHGSMTEALSIQRLEPGASATSMSKVEIAIPSSQFVRAGHYYSYRVTMAVYNRSSALKSRKSAYAETEVLHFCEMPVQPEHVYSSNADFSPAGGISGGSIDLSRAVDRGKATLKAAQMTLNFRGARCNYRASVSLKSSKGGLIASGGSSDNRSFLQKIDYLATARFCGVQTQVNTSADGVSPSTATCRGYKVNRSDLILNVETAKSKRPLLSGRYEDTLIIQIGSPL